MSGQSGQPRCLAVLYWAAVGLALLLAACGSSTTERAAAHTLLAAATTSATSQPTATATSQPTATATTSPSALAGGLSGTLAPGSPLPTEAECAARVHRSSFEPRPDNYTANHAVPTPAQIAGLGTWGPSMGLDPRADSLRTQITGNFTGTTDEILQWVACKWGFNPDIVRAEAVVESYWHQSQLGDWTTDQSLCPPGTWNGSGCYQSYGILQINWYYFQNAWPMSQDDTAFSAEYMYGMIRACYEGWTTYLENGTPLPGYPPYAAGDLWGCLGRWYSGWWYTQGAVDYIAKVKAALAEKPWLSPSF
ncbi:MAG: hypothetical protein ACLQUY_01985 [Ktedonobacterales bacterium]